MEIILLVIGFVGGFIVGAMIAVKKMDKVVDIWRDEYKMLHKCIVKHCDIPTREKILRDTR